MDKDDTASGGLTFDWVSVQSMGGNTHHQPHTTTLMTRRKMKTMVRESHGRKRVVEERDEMFRRYGTKNTESRRVEADRTAYWEARHERISGARKTDKTHTPSSDVFTMDSPMRTMDKRDVHQHQDYRPTQFPMRNAKTRRVEPPIN